MGTWVPDYVQYVSLAPSICSYVTLQLQGSNVRVSISYPADINTPGYAKENLSKVGR